MKKLFIILILLIIVFFALGFFFPLEPFSETEVVFSLERGEGSKEIALNLEGDGLIFWGSLFRLYVLVSGISGDLQAGDYLVNPGMSVSKIAEKFAAGDVIKEKITIIEGWNLRDIGFYFEGKGMFQAEELWEQVGFPLDPKSKEGYLFPDTYLIRGGEPLSEIVQKIEDNFSTKLSLVEEDIEKQDKTLEEIIIMASLLEKEVRTKEDKELVAGILWKRLSIGMALQIDATLSYITGKKSVSISKGDTQINSLYNTYLYRGLPAGPICNPGLESIKAVLSPQSSPYWYYLSTPEGETIFSETLEEHNIAKAMYLK